MASARTRFSVATKTRMAELIVIGFKKDRHFDSSSIPATAEACRISTANRVRYAVQRRGDCATLSEQAVFALGSRLAPSRRTQVHSVRWVGVIAHAYRARALIRHLRDRRLRCGDRADAPAVTPR